jgi:tetratricopeptide (TPR) repeat protein
MMSRFFISAAVAAKLILFVAAISIQGQQTDPVAAPPLSPPPRPAQTPILISAPPDKMPILTREQRRQAYAKLLEGQRFIWTLQNMRSQIGIAAGNRLGRGALAKAVEINPGLAEAYTALAELSFYGNANNVPEAEQFASYAIKVDPNNFGARQLLARIYTRDSQLFSGNLDKGKAEKAISQWQTIARLDPRNAEAWAFLSELYDQTGQTARQIEALEKWSGAARPLDDRFYRYATGRDSLAPDAAIVYLGRAYIKSGETGKAVDLLARVVADNPANTNALTALQEALEVADANDAQTALQTLTQILNLNPTNEALLGLLTTAQLRVGNVDDAAKTLREVARSRVFVSDKETAANILARLGAIYAEAGRNAEAATAFEDALKTLGIGGELLNDETTRDFAARNLPKLVAVYRRSNQPEKARAAAKRLAVVLGSADPTADAQLIQLLRASGENAAALDNVRQARARFPEDLNLLRIEAEILTDDGKVDEAAALLKARVVNKSKQIAVPAALLDDFFLHLTVSRLYQQAGRGAESVAAAQAALDLSNSPQMFVVAAVSLASAQNAAGDFKSAEANLREVLKRDPNNATALNNLGYFLVERGERLPEAINLIRRAVEKEPNNASFLDSLGWAQFKNGQVAEAVRTLEAAVARDPDSATIHLHLGDVYDKLGKPEQARNAWRKALSLSKELAEIEIIKSRLGETRKK